MRNSYICPRHAEEIKTVLGMMTEADCMKRHEGEDHADFVRRVALKRAEIMGASRGVFTVLSLYTDEFKNQTTEQPSSSAMETVRAEGSLVGDSPQGSTAAPAHLIAGGAR